MNKIVFLVDNIITKVMAPPSTLKDVDQVLYDALSTPVLDNLRFTDAFQMGLSDGMIHVYNRDTHTFHSGILDLAVVILTTGLNYYEVTVMDNRPSREVGTMLIKWDNDRFPSRQYQLTSTRKGMKKNGILQLPTGSGKTLVAAKLIINIQQKACFMVPSRTLLYQTKKAFENMFDRSIRIGIIGDSLCDIQDINICSIQTLYAVLSAHYAGKQRVKFNDKTYKYQVEKIDYDKSKMNIIVKMIEDTQVMMFDECHHISADTYTEVARAFRNATWRFGFTATAWREDKREIQLHQLLGPIIHEISLDYMIEQGYLVKPKIDFLDVPQPLDIKKRKYSSALEKEYFVSNLERNALLINKILSMIEDGYKAILVLARFIDHTTILRAMLINANVSVEVVTGSVVAKKRAAIIERFESGSINVLVATDLFGEGFDMPKIDGLVMAQMGKSITKVYQYIGRSLRPSEGKDHALIVDVADRYKWFGQWFEIRLGVYSLEPSFRENIIDNFWKTRIDLIARSIDKGEDRVFKQLS